MLKKEISKPCLLNMSGVDNRDAQTLDSHVVNYVQPTMEHQTTDCIELNEDDGERVADAFLPGSTG